MRHYQIVYELKKGYPCIPPLGKENCDKFYNDFTLENGYPKGSRIRYYIAYPREMVLIKHKML